jgi:peroxidase
MMASRLWSSNSSNLSQQQELEKSSVFKILSFMWNPLLLVTKVATVVAIVLKNGLGCDGSVLISSTRGNRAERESIPNLSLARDGFDAVVRCKKALERACPGVVSCADILAILARDATVLTHGPSWHVLKGRRDGRVSLAANALINLPRGDSDVNQLSRSFESKGLSLLDMIALSGSHTIGRSHCKSFTNRLYTFSHFNATDPSMDKTYAGLLRRACPATGRSTPNRVVPMDRSSPLRFDNLYYVNLVRRQGLLRSDQVLFSSSWTQNAVLQFANNQTSFFAAFAVAMLKMGNIGIKTGYQGEIRRDCTRIN